ncbi:MAG: 3-dehydroquinate synthase [Planctomycetaceae bacterium]|nr:3-dehydroquinate synthase [Planctomycetaceae bacterium]|tara:strand:+ start:8902 stop:10641 length:1740 start_codon:yes stop_codon:yes gene_type:complete
MAETLKPREWIADEKGEMCRRIAASRPLYDFIEHITKLDPFSDSISNEFKRAGMIAAVPAYRMLRCSLGMQLGQFVRQLATVMGQIVEESKIDWERLATTVEMSHERSTKLMDVLSGGELQPLYQRLADQLVNENPHAVYPTSSYRESSGKVIDDGECNQVEAVMTSKTYTSIRIIEGVLDHDQDQLRSIYSPLGRCVCFVDENVDVILGKRISSYFEQHHIELHKLSYRAMEVDKGISTVESMLADLKRLGVSRNEPVLIIGGGVLSDTGGLACGLYHRGTPYVMLSSSLVAGIDAGPSPRTCCDGFGYKNLFGSYHAPILSIVDRTLFSTLKPGWVRHGIAEIIKMAVVKDAQLFNDLELAGPTLVRTRFGASLHKKRSAIHNISRRILGRAIRSYVDAEYGNLYETHQCRPHAYGHTWSPGFEIPAGMLHGHAVSAGMGFGAFLSMRNGWINEEDCHRILRLVSGFELSLWHPVLNEKRLVWEAQVKMVEKRGGHLAAPLPKNRIGECGYLNHLGERELYSALQEYEKICRSFPRKGLGIEAHCRDVGLEDPATVGCSLQNNGATVQASTEAVRRS